MNTMDFSEQQLTAIYNSGTRTDTLNSIFDMKKYISPEEPELLELTESVIRKLETMTDAEFEALDLVPDVIM